MDQYQIIYNGFEDAAGLLLIATAFAYVAIYVQVAHTRRWYIRLLTLLFPVTLFSSGVVKLFNIDAFFIFSFLNILLFFLQSMWVISFHTSRFKKL